MTGTILALWLAAAAAPASPTCPPAPPLDAVRLGPHDAEIAVDTYLDPTTGSALTTWLELRRLAGEHRGELAIATHFMREGHFRDPVADDVRAWAMAWALRGHLLPALRVLDREGADRIHVRLQTVESANELAREVAGSQAEPPSPSELRCAARWIEENTVAARRALGGGPPGGPRSPVHVIDGDHAFEGSPALDRLRPGLASYRSTARQQRLAAQRTAVPEIRGVSVRLRRPDLDGAVLGGPGLPHRFVVMGRDEDDPSLFNLLPPVLAHRSRHPGEIAVHVVARGMSVGASVLRHRLCAARRLGRVVEYVRYLAEDPSRRRSTSAVDAALLQALDAVPEERCENEADPAELGLPDGGWLDGIPRTRSELESLETTLLLLGAAHRPLSPFLGTRPDEP